MESFRAGSSASGHHSSLSDLSATNGPKLSVEKRNDCHCLTIQGYKFHLVTLAILMDQDDSANIPCL